MAFEFRPTDANTVDVKIGVGHILPDYIIHNENITCTVDTLTVPDQQNRIAQVFAYQKHYNFDLTLVGPSAYPFGEAGTSAAWYKPNGTAITYIIDEQSRQCAYNDLARWSVKGTAYINAAYHDATDAPLP